MTAASPGCRQRAGIEGMDEHKVRVKRELRRRHVLAAATEVFATRGYHAAKMDQIADRAGYPKPVLYEHFQTKLDLYLAVLSDPIHVLVESVRRALRSPVSNEKRVAGAVEAYFDFVDQDIERFRLVFDSDAASEPSVQWRVGRGTDACVEAIAQLVADDAGLAVQQARLLAAGLVGASRFAAQYWLETGRVIPKSDAVDAVVTLCWGGLSSVPIEQD
ncbi:transcriptional regulator, TetR family [Nocardia amikacinitolerans]|uniref:TetR/AcrR family transcriptional regulator n=1 Tax=Nocardia amikacinitolerans TaxID=756689 RepID=UPI000A8FB82E|nr:TetR/AcrR family transcriptional regulator [Nocardia amikacinitolerans]MCP2317717.1 transcriptional regulator, TetR family [Nocardia amikacinitolerans]